MSVYEQQAGGISALSAIGSTPNANAATITGTTLNLEPASVTFGGVVTNAAQTMFGNKIFSVPAGINEVKIHSGTTAGQANLKVQGNNATKNANVLMGNTAMTGTLFGVARANTAQYIANDSPLVLGTVNNYEVTFGTNSLAAITIDTSQRVGVGSTSPSQAFCVGSSNPFRVTSTGQTFSDFNGSAIQTTSANGYFNTFLGDNLTSGYRINSQWVLRRNNSNNNLIVGGTGAYTSLTGASNVFIGRDSGTAASSGSQNVAIGGFAVLGAGVLTGGGNVAVGNTVMNSATSAAANIGIGSSILNAITSGSENIGIGNSVLSNISTTSQNIGIGGLALRDITTATGNIGIGNASGYGLRTGSYNVAIGISSMGSSSGLSTSQYNTSVGYYSGFQDSGTANVNLGYQSGYAGLNNTAVYSIRIGFQSGGRINGNHNIAIGSEISSNSATAGSSSQSILIGYRAGYSKVIDGLTNTIIGAAAVSSAGTLSGQNNTVIGASASSALSSGYWNVNVGAYSSQAQSTGLGNITIGALSNNALTTGNRNVVIGYNTGASVTGAMDDRLVIGSTTNELIVGNFATQTAGIQGSLVAGAAVPASSAVLEANSTTKGFLLPRMTTAQKTAIAGPVAGLMVYDTTLNRPCFYDGGTWVTL